jgi:sugar phosphate isomerase/epimerase
MKIAVSTLHLMQYSLEDVLEQLVDLDTNLVELADGGFHALNSGRVEQLLEIKTSYDLKYGIHAPWADTNLSANDSFIRERILERIKASIRFASILDAKSLVIHPGWRTAIEHFRKGFAWELNLNSIKLLINYADEFGIDLLIENVPLSMPYLLVYVADFMRFFEEIENDTGMTLDIAHSSLQDETINFIKIFSEKIKHVHVSDNYGIRDDHLPIGHGIIDWSEAIKALKINGFTGWVTIESYYNIQQSIEFLKKLF